MISKSAAAVLLAFFGCVAAKAGDPPYPAPSTVIDKVASPGDLLMPIGRPLLLRSDMLSDANYASVRAYARKGVDPRTGIPYSGRGFPKFKSFFDVQLKPSQYRSLEYGKICNNKLYEAIQNNPKLGRRFTTRDIELLKNGRNPQGYHWHHNEKQGLVQLVEEYPHSTEHKGGSALWGPKSASPENLKAVAKATAMRWGMVAVFDIALSSASMVYTKEFDFDHFMQATTRATAGGAAAFGTEFLLVKVMPNAVGTTPSWVCGMRILFGSPAAWVATLSYATTRALVDYCWESYRLRQLQIQEQACRAAEGQARWQRIESAVKANTDDLIELLANRPEVERGVQ